MFKKKSFILLICVLLVLASLIGCSAPAPKKSTDVIVIGGGLAGLSAAITAADNGSKVILVEKMAFTGGSSMLSGGSILAAESHVQKREGMTQTKDELEAYWYEQQAMTSAPEGYPKKDYVRMIIDNAPDTIQFLEDNGTEFARPISFYPETKDRLHNPTNNSGSGYTKPLTETAKEKGIEIILETTATKLTQDKDGKITGVVLEGKDAKSYTISAKSVILANGGFSNNPDMIGKLSETSKQHISVAGMGNVGDGYKMAKEVGADFHAEDWIIGLRSQAVEGSSPLNGLSWTTGLYTTLEGARFTNENYPYSVLYNSVADQNVVDYFLIFDHTMAQAVEPGIELGVAFKGANIEELAKVSGMKSDVLKSSIERYNELAAKGVDEDFGKQSELMLPIADGELYALKVKASQMGTMGGVKTNMDMEVLNKEGNVIPGLYAAGEMANRPFYGRVYVTGSSLQIAATTGRIAGASATK